MALALNLTTDALRDLLGGRFRSRTPRRVWASLRSPVLAGDRDVAILGRRVPLDAKRTCEAGLRIVGPDFPDEHVLEVPSPEDALATLVFHLASNPVPDQWLSSEEIVARFGELARFSRIHRSACIGDGCRLGAGVVVHAGVSIGPGCVLCDHAVVGSPGFGLCSPPPVEGVQTTPLVALREPQEPGNRNQRNAVAGSVADPVPPPVELVETCHTPLSPHSLLLPHRAGVVLEDDVFLGPQVNVAAGLIEPTFIGAGCRIDALVQIGHNARIGPRCVFAGQSGVAGSAELGADCMVGGQAAISDHVRLGARCVVAARAGVTKSWGDCVVLHGFPARPVSRRA